ncbi:MAG: putative membrane protein [Saprospiraceae bacterium]|jgi:uncharacterized membrane protein
MILFIDFIGRFHPLLLHLPIGILVYAYLQWSYDLLKKKSPPTDLKFALVLGCISAIFSACSGWVLAEQGGYDQELLDWHKYLGISTAVGSIILLVVYRLGLSKLLFGLIFTAFMILLAATGHYGGSLTHGKGFLTKRIEKKETKTVTNIQEAHIFNDIVMPIFDRKCIGCHNPEKSKGDLQFHNLQGWQKGGENGEVLKAGFPLESYFLQRVHLPKEDEEHMPPDGKLQLSIEEKDFLEWWIMGMKNYDHLVKELFPTPKVSLYLKSLEGDEFEGIEKISQKTIFDLYQSGIIANPISANTPWIDVSFNNKTSVKSSLKKLKRIAQNVIEIDLSNTDISDRDIKLLNQFKNLKKLNLSGCNISNKAIDNLQHLTKLANLNLYKTQIGNKSLDYLANIKSLEKVYLWQTSIDKSKAKIWAKDNTTLNIDLGVDQSIFGTPKLAGPIINADTELFKDSLLISLITSNPRAKITYSVNSNDGVSTNEYSNPFKITKSSEISAYLHQDGWSNSDTTKNSFVRAKYKPVDISLSTTPSEKYPGDGPTTLIDFTKGSESFGDGKWLGFHESDASTVVDLGAIQTIESVSVGSLIDDRSYIFPPKGINIKTSKDGKNFQQFANENYGTQDGPVTAQTINHILHGDLTQARYIKVDIEGQKYNPHWHAAPGAACWLFVDEIVVE